MTNRTRSFLATWTLKLSGLAILSAHIDPAQVWWVILGIILLCSHVTFR